jgi:hypothetical protein
MHARAMGDMCVDTRSATRGCQGISSKQWELGSSGVASRVCSIWSFEDMFLQKICSYDVCVCV